MLSAIRITNFKAFGETQEIPIRPITLIYGPNSAGKSSVLHALAYAHHASRTGELDVHKTQLGGESIDLGGFRQFIHRRDIENVLTLEFVVDVADTAAPWNVTASVSIKFDPDVNEPRVRSYAFSSDGEEVLALRVGWDGKEAVVVSLAHEHPLLQRFLQHMANADGVELDPELGLAHLRELPLDKVVATRRGLLPVVTGFDRRAKRVQGGGGKAATVRELGGGKVLNRRTPWGSEQAWSVEDAALLVLKQIVNRTSADVEAALASLSYIGPLREYPERDMLFRNDARPVAAGTGADAWRTIAFNEAVRTEANRWLGAEHMTTPYRLDAYDLGAAEDLASSVTNALVELVEREDSDDERAVEDEDGTTAFAGGPDSTDSATRGTGVTARGSSRGSGFSGRAVTLRQAGGGGARRAGGTQRFAPTTSRDPLEVLQPSRLQPFVLETIANAARASTNRVVSLVLVDRARNTQVSPRDVGVGVSQVLPVLAYSLAKREAIIAIEQPELHLHPALQAELGDLFIESALGTNANRVLLETHSEHLLLRVMRRIRAASGRHDEAEGLAKPARESVSNGDVAVLYVVPRAGGSEVRDLCLNEYGDFEVPWPNGFFAERALENL
jgi:hypothetical protein